MGKNIMLYKGWAECSQFPDVVGNDYGPEGWSSPALLYLMSGWNLEPLGDHAKERLSGVVYPDEEPDSPGISNRIDSMSIVCKKVSLVMKDSVRRSSPRTAKRPRTRLDRTNLGPDRSPGPASVLNGPVLILNFSGKLRTSPGPVRTSLLPLFNRGSN